MTEQQKHWTTIDKQNHMTYGGFHPTEAEARKEYIRFSADYAFSDLKNLLKEKDWYIVAPFFAPFLVAEGCSDFLSRLIGTEQIELSVGDRYMPWGTGSAEYIHGVNDIGAPHMDNFSFTKRQKV